MADNEDERMDEPAEEQDAGEAPAEGEEGAEAEEAMDAGAEEGADAAAEDGGEEAGDADMKDAAEEEGEKAEEEKVEEAPKETEKELEEDAPADSRPKLSSGAVTMDQSSASLNALVTAGGRTCTALADHGLGHFVATVRANTGVSKGRYFFEVTPLEGARTSSESSGGRDRGLRKEPFFALGFVTKDSTSHFIGFSETALGFDSRGQFCCGGDQKRRVISKPFGQHEVLGCLLNLDASSANANTVSLFCNGVRLCAPQKLPEELVGETFVPVVNYKNATMQLNFGPVARQPLPFECRMIGDAAKADTATLPALASAGADGRQEVVFPVALPDEGTFDWLDQFLAENPKYVELSERKLLDWARCSGVPRPKGYDYRVSNDRPGGEFGIADLDNGGHKRFLNANAALLGKSYVMMEVRNNLLLNERKKALSLFDGGSFKKTALVVLGEPPAAFKAKAVSSMLEERQAKVAKDVRSKRKKEDQRKAVEERAKKRREEAEKRKKDDAKDGEKKEEEKKEEEKKDDEKKEAEPQETIEEAVQKAVDAIKLTEEEQKMWFGKHEVMDMHSKELAKQFANFCLPSKEEGFDEVKFLWQSESGSASYLKDWILEKKKTSRLDELHPGSWFQEKSKEFHKLCTDWKRRHSAFKDPVRRRRAAEDKAADKARAEKADQLKRESDERAKKKEEEEKKAEDGAEEDGENKEEEEPEKEAPAADEAMEEEADGKKAEEEKEEAKEINVEDLDVWTVEDVSDVGSGEPLYSKWASEDWSLLHLRGELHLLVHGFQKDSGDAERPTFPEQHLGFYYQKYYRKPLKLENYGVKSHVELLRLIEDTLEATEENPMLDAMLSDDTPFDNFIKLTEDARRERQRLIDLGDEDAKLKFRQQDDRPERPEGKGKGKGHGKGHHDRDDRRGPPMRDMGRPGSFAPALSRGGPVPSGYPGRPSPALSSGRGLSSSLPALGSRPGFGSAPAPARGGYGRAPDPRDMRGGRPAPYEPPRGGSPFGRPSAGLPSPAPGRGPVPFNRPTPLPSRPFGGGAPAPTSFRRPLEGGGSFSPAPSKYPRTGHGGGPDRRFGDSRGGGGRR
eukprot:TRINITY_DN207_c0_g5_i1.p1 TRINITY_DN207_c0_g5~~TRINITY_DN207_c0_g5_i1.p1  ORF type:complete len:1080 (+),score=419.53 TRINITY_DN207_c0_g5_i1:107-3346(+)